MCGPCVELVPMKCLLVFKFLLWLLDYEPFEDVLDTFEVCRKIFCVQVYHYIKILKKIFIRRVLYMFLFISPPFFSSLC